ncbi:MAG TPA: two-component regulator propeller domain-containing protein [Chitinophagaceae bacterium]|nr:two-component regulator propeller domain-containing protein [Chitinophagaceae bacterium]
MPRWFLILVFFFTAGCCFPCLSQPPAVFFDHIDTEDGLSNNHINSIIKDKHGFLWIGTADGLNRYDGKNFVSFFHSISDSRSLPHNDVYSLLEDDFGYIWAGTVNGLCRINPYTSEILRVRIPPGIDTSSFFVINDIKQGGKHNTVWVATNKGLFWINQKKNELVRAANNATDSSLNNLIITKIVIASPDTFWLGTYEGLARYHPSNGLFTSFRVPSAVGASKTLVKSVYRDKSGRLWLATWGRGLQRFDPKTQEFTRFLPREDLGERSDANIIFNIAQTGYPGEDSILWIAADATALLAFNMQTGRFTPYAASDENDRHGIAGHGFVFCQGKSEGLWIGGSKGLYRYDPHHQLFRNVRLRLNSAEHCLQEALTVYADPLDPTGKTLLVSTWSCGSYRLNLANESLQELPAWIMRHMRPGSHITSFSRDRDGALWMATSSNTLVRADESRQTAEVMEPLAQVRLSKQYYIQHLLDDGKGNVWMGTRRGLFMMNKKERAVKTIFLAGQDAPEFLSDEITALTLDRYNNLWFCTNLRQDKKPVVGKVAAGSAKPVLFYHQTNDPERFPETSPLQGITADKAGNVWCASWNGLLHWKANEANPVFKRLTRMDGLSNDKIFKVYADRQDYIWIATLRGISCYDPLSLTFRNYYTAQGLYQDDVSNFFRNDVTGGLMAGYAGSIDIIDPTRAHRTKEEPTVIITSLRVFNEVYADNRKSYVNKGWASLSPGQNMITISFSALSFTDPRQVRYAYKMEGVDKDWTLTENDFVTYHNLPPGSRKFFVKARNAEGVWSKEGTWLEIDLAPPFYRKWWFIALVVAAVAVVIYLLYRARIRRLEEKFRIRSTIARDLHDEIGSTLTSINILSLVSRSNLHKDRSRAEGLLQKITEQSQDMQQSMSDIIWAIKPDNDKLEDMAAHMREYLSHTLEVKNIAIHFEADEQALKTSLSMEQRRDFFLIFKEAVNNAAKYADSNAVTISLKKNKKHIVLVVADQGVGFDVTKKYSSNGLKNMQARAASLRAALTITSAPGKGTQVQLSIPTT